jgi:uncharacterized protein YcaQ
MATPRIPLRAAAALFLERQQLDRPRGRRLTAASLARFARATGGIQLDSINVVERAHYLTLWSRFGAYDRARLDRLVYRRRVLFEYFAHMASLIATDDFPAWRHTMVTYSRRSKGWSKFLKKHGETMRFVEQQVRDRGPIGTAHFEQPQQKRAAGWWNWKPTTHALDHLWMSGILATHSRRHFHRRFDLMERVLPGPLALEPLDAEAFARWHLERSLSAMGVATETDLRMYLTYPRRPVGERRALLRRMIGEGVVTEVALEHQRGSWFALTRDVPELERAGRKRVASSGTTFLCPFDSVMWHRERIQKLFGFDYKIEVYVPQPKRKYGYYVLPLFHDGAFIGRADLKTHRADGVLEIRALHFEPWFANGGAPPAARWGKVDRDAALRGTAEAMRSLATFVEAREVRVRSVTPRSLSAPLARELKAAR